MVKYQIGEWVRVDQPGHTYGSYKEKFDELGVANEHIGYDSYNCEVFRKNDIVRVYNIGRHNTHSDRTLYAIRDCLGRESLIEESGLATVANRREFIAGQHDVSYDPDLGRIYLTWHGTPLETDVLIITNPVTGISVEFGPVPGAPEQWLSESGLTVVTNDNVFHNIPSVDND